jgi:hypothetical protein
MLAADATVVIRLTDCHAVVSRYRALHDGSISCERATNAEALEPAALEAITGQDQPVLLGAHYPCPSDVAAQAIWSDGPS